MKKTFKIALVIANLLSGAYTLYLIGKDIAYPYLKEINMTILGEHLASIVVILIFVVSGGILLYGWYSNNLKKGRIEMRNLGESRRIIRNPEGYQYLVEGDTCFHIPDPDTFNYLGNYFGFTWGDSQLMLPEDIKRKYNMGKTLPSIRVYFPKVQQP